MEIQAPNQTAYDRAIVVFSPEGRIFQVEYARKAVTKASTTLGIVFAKGVVLAAFKVLSKFIVPASITKIVQIDEHIGAASCGIIADARALIDYARIRAQINRMTFDEPIEVKELAKQVADRKQRFTQIGGIRPYGVSLLIAGEDEHPHLMETDPSGVLREWKAHAIGRGANAATKVIEKEYKEGLNREAAIRLGLKALKAAESNADENSIELGIVENRKFYKITDVKTWLK